MKNVFIAFALLIISVCPTFAMSSSEPDFKLHYKIIINVKTPEGIKSGSAVRELVYDIPLIKMHDGGSGPDIRGEAVAVDMEERGKLFGLITWDSYYELYRAFPYNEGRGGEATKDGIAYSSLPIGTKTDLTNKRSWPTMVTFTDMDDPKSVKPVITIQRCNWGVKGEVEKRCNKDGAYIKENNLEDFFGEGVSIQNVTIEIVDQPITKKIHSLLPWLQKINGGYLHGGKTSRKAPLGLHGGNFDKGGK